MAGYGSGPYGSGPYGTGGVTVTYVFRPPTAFEGYGLGAMLRGKSVWRKAGVWTTRFRPSDYELDGADRIYLGGHEYPLTAALAAELTAAGFTVDQVGGTYVYSSGPYGSGPFGGSV